MPNNYLRLVTPKWVVYVCMSSESWEVYRMKDEEVVLPFCTGCQPSVFTFMPTQPHVFCVRTTKLIGETLQ